MMRVTPAGEGFVLYQMTKKEVTAVAVGQGRLHLRRRRGQQAVRRSTLLPGACSAPSAPATP